MALLGRTLTSRSGLPRLQSGSIPLTDAEIQQQARELGRIESGFQAEFGKPDSAFILPELRKAIAAEQQGMSLPEEAMARQQIGQSFNSALGRMGSQTARAGAYSPSSVATAGAGRPARSLAQSLLGLQAQKAQMRRAGSQAAAGQLAGLAQYPLQSERAGQEAFGSRIAQLQQRRPVSGLSQGPRSSFNRYSQATSRY